MANNNAQLLADLRLAIDASITSQRSLQDNTGIFNTAITDGLASINATIRSINDLLVQVEQRIDRLKNRIAELEAGAGPDPAAGFQHLIRQLNAELVATQAAQADSVLIMGEALETLKSNKVAMDATKNAQVPADMTNQLEAVNNSLLNLQENLRRLLDEGPQQPPGPGPQPGPRQPGAVEQMRAEQGEDSDDEEVDPDSDDEPGALGGNRRRKNKTAKKRCKTKRKSKTKKNKKQKGGYGYKTRRRKYKQDSDTSVSSASSNTGLGSGRGRGKARGIYKKSKKRRAKRS